MSSVWVEDRESDDTQDEGLGNIAEIPQKKGVGTMAETADEESVRELDDDQMMAMDDELTLMFKDRVKGRKGKGVFSRFEQPASVDGQHRRSAEGSHTFQKPDYGSFGHLR